MSLYQGMKFDEWGTRDWLRWMGKVPVDSERFTMVVIIVIICILFIYLFYFIFYLKFSKHVKNSEHKIVGLR